jgi:ornithine cyclodeaminase/alanine dehydrogenase-like protein (mu-crystallin family)
MGRRSACGAARRKRSITFTREEQAKYGDLKSDITDLERTVSGADVVVTVTPARGPIVKNEWIAPGTHIAAVGADKAGDQELDPRIVQRARIFVDDIRQCRTDGKSTCLCAKG